MGKTWSTAKGCWVDDKTGNPPPAEKHNVWSTDKNKFVKVEVGKPLPPPKPAPK